ncbi:MAG: ABC transporter [Clostridiales bacterium GWB2_37_7]|nr:MAG: ABC transporter [Clostridiales bacterium GWB2_37_7]
MKPIVQVEGFTKFYGSNKVIDNISFEIYPGEIFALLGPNGAGKTSTLECIEGIRKATAGKLRVSDLNPEKDFKKIRKRLGVQLQASALPDIITVEEAMKMFCLYLGNETRYDLLERFDLKSMCNTEFCKLSTGQQRKLILAIALAHHPELLILDEPTAGLDVHTRVELHEIMREERAKGTAILLASHDMSEVEELADRVAILVKGRIVAEGTPNEIITSGDSNVKIYVKTLKDALSDIKLERAQATSEGYVVFDTEDIEDTVGLILSHIKSKGDKLMDLRIERPSLEERFINITRNGGIQ